MTIGCGLVSAFDDIQGRVLPNLYEANILRSSFVSAWYVYAAAVLLPDRKQTEVDLATITNSSLPLSFPRTIPSISQSCNPLDQVVSCYTPSRMTASSAEQTMA